VVSEPDAPEVRAALDAVDGLGGLTTDGDRPGTVALAGALDTHVDAFVKAIAGFGVVDLTIEEPDLEESVLGYYGTEEER
jgi:ABC-2 type transport system ATP-binding protein